MTTEDGDVRPPISRAHIVLLAGLMASAAVAAAFLFQPPLWERVGTDGLAHLSVEAIPVDGLVWGDETRGPGDAFLQAERLMHRTTAVLLLMVAAVGGLGQMASAGVVAVSRRAELRLRRAVGAPRNRLLRGLARESVRSLGWGLLAGVGVAIVALTLLQAMWTASPELVTPSLGSGQPMALGVGVAAGILVAWAGLAFLVVQSAEVMPGAPLHPRTRLAEPSQGELCHPGVPALQIAAVCLVLTSGAVLVAGAERLWDADPRRGVLAELPRTLVTSEPGEAARVIRAILDADSPFRGGEGGRVSVTSPGFAEGVGHVRYAQTECGVCFVPGSPPARAPYKGEVAVHHAVSPDTFRMAGIRVLDGREFTPADDAASEPVAIVSRRFAAEHFQDGEAIGRRVRIGSARDRWHTVVGVVDALPRTSLPARTLPLEDVFVPVAQVPPVQVEVVSAGVPEPSIFPARTRPVAPPAQRELLIASWGSSFVNLWRGAGLAAAILAMTGVATTVGRRVREEANEIAIHRAVGATRRRMVARYLTLGLGIGAVGSGLGCWGALFVVGVIVPEGFGAPGMLTRIFLTVGGSLVLASGVVAATVAGWEMRGTPS